MICDTGQARALVSILLCTYRSSKKYKFDISSTEGIEKSLGVRGSQGPKTLKKCKEFNWNFQRGGRFLQKIPSVREVLIL